MSRSAFILAAVLALGAGGLAAPAASAPPPKGPPINHIVVIYEENHSFDNLFGGWERVNGLDDASAQPHLDPIPLLRRDGVLSVAVLAEATGVM